MRAEYSYCRDYLIKNGKPWFPVMGEMHYSRYRKEWWEESLRKIKAGGVSVVSAYVIWIHHEEEENVFDFEGCRDIGTFVRLCRKSDCRYSCVSDRLCTGKCGTADSRTGSSRERKRAWRSAVTTRNILAMSDGSGKRFMRRSMDAWKRTAVR